MTTRTVRRGRCGRCRRAVLRGLDEDAPRTAWAVTVDVKPVSELGEYLAWRVGLRTFELIGDRLYARYAGRIRQPRQFRVLASHCCGIVWPEAKPGDPGVPPRRSNSDEPPY